MKLPPSVSYSIRRIGLFVATLLFLSLVLRGWSPVVILALATVVSGLLSFFLLSGPRKEMAASLESRVKGLGNRIDRVATWQLHSDSCHRRRSEISSWPLGSSSRSWPPWPWRPPRMRPD